MKQRPFEVSDCHKALFRKYGHEQGNATALNSKLSIRSYKLLLASFGKGIPNAIPYLLAVLPSSANNTSINRL